MPPKTLSLKRGQSTEQIISIPLTELYSFPDHPYGIMITNCSMTRIRKQARLQVKKTRTVDRPRQNNMEGTPCKNL